MNNRALSLMILPSLCLSLLCGCGSGAGQSPSTSPAVSAPAEQESPSPTPPNDSAWQDILQAMPYCGDASQCSMTAEQALAYAQLLADGIAGKVPEGADHYDCATSDVIFWDAPYTVRGYSDLYQTDRASVILGDFAGDGSAYLCVLSSLNPECGFDVYWSDGGAARHLYGDETYMGRRSTSFALDEDGKMTISTGGSNGAASHSAAQYGFSDGKVVELYSYFTDYDYDTDLMHETINGVESTYTLEEWEQKQSESGDDWTETPSASYTPIPLRSMIDYLNQYAAAKGSTQSVTMAERSDTSKMAEAMLAAMDSELSGWDDREEARLVDLNGDGIKELAVYNGEQAWLHYWSNGQLQTMEIGWVAGGWVEWWLCEDTATGEKGIEWRVNGGGDFTGGTSVFYYLSHEASIGDHRNIEPGSVTRYTVDEAEVTQAEYDAARTQNRRIEDTEFISEAGAGTHVETTRAELRSLL